MAAKKLIERLKTVFFGENLVIKTLKFGYLISQFRHSPIVVHPLLRKILDNPLPQVHD